MYLDQTCTRCVVFRPLLANKGCTPARPKQHQPHSPLIRLPLVCFFSYREVNVKALRPGPSAKLRARAPTRIPALATTVRRGLKTTEYLYVKLPCPSAHTSYSKVQFQHYNYTTVP